MYNKTTQAMFIFLLVFALLLNFTIQTKKTYAVALPIATAVGGIEIAKNLVAFITLMYAYGVTFNSVQEAQKLAEQYWQQQNPEPKDPKDPNNRSWLKWTLGVLTGATLIDSVVDLYTNVKSFLTDIFGTLKPGTNINSTEVHTELISYTITREHNYNNTAWVKRITLYTGQTAILYQYPYDQTIFDETISFINNWGDLNVKYEYKYYYNGELETVTTQFGTKIPGTTYDYYLQGKYKNPTIVPTSEIIITPDAPIIQPEITPETNIPVPMLPNIKYHPDLDDDKIQLAPLPDGSLQEYFRGTPDEYLEFVVQNYTFDDLKTAPQTTVTESIDSQGMPILSFGTTTYIPPYPDTTPTPIEDTTEYQGIIRSLVMTVINWLRLIWEAIISIPKEIEEVLKSLLLPDSGYIGGKLDDILTSITSKFDDSSWIMILENLRGLEGKPIPDLYYKESVILKSSYANDIAPTVKNWISFGMIVAIVLFNMNNLYKLIRGTGFIDGKALTKAMDE